MDCSYPMARLSQSRRATREPVSLLTRGAIGENDMPHVIIHPGGTSEPQEDGLTTIWTFEATVDGRAGIVQLDLPGDSSRAEAAQAAKSLLEEDPGQLEGIV